MSAMTAHSADEAAAAAAANENVEVYEPWEQRLFRKELAKVRQDGYLIGRFSLTKILGKEKLKKHGWTEGWFGNTIQVRKIKKRKGFDGKKLPSVVVHYDLSVHVGRTVTGEWVSWHNLRPHGHR